MVDKDAPKVRQDVVKVVLCLSLGSGNSNIRYKKKTGLALPLT